MPNVSISRVHQRAISNAVANQRLEGLQPDKQSISDLGRVARGETTVSEVIGKLRRRVAAGDFKKESA